jgi:putative FmdB family regulatory protein
MPIYEYLCDKCGHEFEREQRMTDAPVKTCPSCKGRKVTKLISRSSFVLKGGGWYADGYADSKKKSEAKESGTKEGESKESGSKESGSKESDGSKKSESSSESSTAKSSESKPKSGGDKGKKKGTSKSAA